MSILSTESTSEREPILALYNRLAALGDAVDEQYAPSMARGDRFLDRAASFVQSGVTVEEQRDLMQLLAETMFVDRMLYDGLLCAAHHTRVMPWLAEMAELDHSSKSLPQMLNLALSETMLLSLTDSFSVADYVHQNSVPSQKHRPDVRSLKAFSDVDCLREKLRGKKYFVVLDDFVGTGVQSSGPIAFLSKVTDAPVLVVPLVICHQGLRKWRRDFSHLKNFTFDPVIILGPDVLLADTPDGRGDEGAARQREALRSIDPKVRAGSEASYPGYLGFGAIGSLYVRFANCPNNSVSALHQASPEWTPPFPRAVR